MTPQDYDDLVALLDGRIDELTKPIPSRQILRFAESIRSAQLGDDESVATYGEDDYQNLLETQRIVNELLPRILASIRAGSVNPATGWRFEKVKAANGDYGLCAICRDPFQHFKETVKVHCVDMHDDAFHGVCRECVRNYAPIKFIESGGVVDWLSRNRSVCDPLENDGKTEGQRRDLIDAIRHHAHSTHYFSKVVQSAPEWAHGAFGEWR